MRNSYRRDYKFSLKMSIIKKKEYRNDITKHPMYKDGRTLIKKRCKDCGKKIRHWAIRCKSCAKKGKLHPLWNGGTRNLPYAYNWRSIRRKIRLRDKCKCILCSAKERKRKHDIHHIDYNKKNNDDYNLITICVKCHAKINFNRDYWYAYFTYIINRRR